MLKIKFLKPFLFGTIWASAIAAAAFATSFNIPAGSLEDALKVYSTQSGVHLLIPNDQIDGARTNGVRGDLPVSEALQRILLGTGFIARKDSSGVVGIVPQIRRSQIVPASVELAATPSASG